MKKQALVALLWFYSGWYAGAMAAWALGVTPFIGPLVGLVAAAVVVADSGRFAWRRDGA